MMMILFYVSFVLLGNQPRREDFPSAFARVADTGRPTDQEITNDTSSFQRSSFSSPPPVQTSYSFLEPMTSGHWSLPRL